MVKHLFLDLEDTVITPIVEGWSEVELINQDKVRSFISEFGPDYIHIFSFAIWNLEDLASFDWHIRGRLEKSLGISIATAPMLDDEITPACCNAKWMRPDRVTRQDVIDFWGKQEAFRLYVRNRLPGGGDVVLLDDMVEHEEFSFPSLELTGRIINISDI